MRLLVRRPHAYKFVDDHKGAAIPGVTTLDADGHLLVGVDLKATDALKSLTVALKSPPAAK